MYAKILVLLFSFSATAGAQTDARAYLHNFLAEFDKNPATAMDRLPPKFDSSGRRLSRVHSPFSSHLIPERSFVNSKDSTRSKLCPKIKPGRSCQLLQIPAAGFGGFSELDLFLGKDYETSAEKMNTTALRAAKTKVQPWSGDYFATYRGGIAARYADPNYPAGTDFKTYYNWHKKNSQYDFSDAEAINRLSPAEKYDLLVGDESRSLTRWSLDDALRTYKMNGKIEEWFGLCHGWAPAAFMMERPLRTVTIPISSKGIELKFYPDDIKALATALWANARFPTRFMGGRCNDKNPKKDANGRIISEDCFDTNPGAFHIALVNLVGQRRQSFVIDATYDYEVWNQPISSYRISYFNPQTRKPVNNLDNAIVPIEDFTADKFKKYRDSNTRFVVGISLELSYIKGSTASHRSPDRPSHDGIETVLYVYDLEINSEGIIIGGEWYQNAHPDFMWLPIEGSMPVTIGEHLATGRWDGTDVVPASWTTAAVSSSAWGQPLAKVVKKLIEMSRSR